MTVITLNTSNSKEDKGSKIEYTYPALRGVKMVNGQYSFQLNQSLSPNLLYSSKNVFISGKAKNYYIVLPNHQFGTEKTHEYELVIEHYTESGIKFFIVLPLKIGGTSTLNNVIKSTNTVGETLDLNKDMKNPSNIYNYFSGTAAVFVFQSYINVYAISDDKLSDSPFNPPTSSNLTVKYTTGNQKFSDEVVCGEEDVTKPKGEPDTKYIFIMALVGAVFLSMSLMGLSWLANSGLSKQIKMISLLISVTILLSAMGGSLVLYLKYAKQLNALYKTLKLGTGKVKNTEKTEMYKTIFGSLSIIFAVALLGAFFFMYGVVNPKVENAIEAGTGTGTGSGKYASIFK